MRRPQRSWNDAGVFKAAQMGDPRRGRGHPGPDGRARGLGRVSARRVRGLFPFARERGHDFQPHHLFFRHWVYLGRPFTGQKGAAHGRACRRGAAGGGLLRRGLIPGENPWFFYGVFSVPVGLGCAFLYPSVMSCAQKWYADRKAWPRRHRRAAVGASGAVLTFLGRFLIGTWSIRTAFWVLGLLMLAVCGAGAAILENPEQPPRETAKQKRGGGPAPKKAAGLQRKRNAQNKPILADVRRSGACNAGRAAVQPHHRGAGTGTRAFADGGRWPASWWARSFRRQDGF